MAKTKAAVSGTKRQKRGSGTEATSTERSRSYRARLRALGMKEKTLTFPAHREDELMAYIESLGPGIPRMREPEGQARLFDFNEPDQTEDRHDAGEP